jgi:hypothetical protein
MRRIRSPRASFFFPVHRDIQGFGILPGRF